MSAIAVHRPAERLAFRRVLVPLDGSMRAETALRPAQALARALQIPLELVSVSGDTGEAHTLSARLDALAVPLEAGYQTRLADHVLPALAAAFAEEPGTLLCMASHGRGRVGGSLLGSVATQLLTMTGSPVVMVGPGLDPRRPVTGGPVVACVDGSPVSEQILAPAAAWAMALGVPLWIATVSEPVPPGLDGRAARPRFGPEDPRAYVGRLAAGWKDRLAGVVPVAVLDPISPADGIRRFLGQEMGGMLAVTTHARVGVVRALLGSVTASLIRTSPIPVLVAPPVHPALAGGPDR